MEISRKTDGSARRGGGGFFFKKNAIFIAFSGVSRQFRPINFNLTSRRCRCRLDECFNGMVMFDMALKMDTNGGLLQTIDGHKFSPRHSMNKPFFFQIKDEIIIDVLSS